MKMNTVFNEDGLMKNGKQFSRMANFLNEKENSFFSRKRKIMKGKVDNKKLNKPVRGRRELELIET
ncbi:TPA: hypothetical protein NV714_003669 [Escherichia coli]|nr:hypothetical protein [Escherichia coli]